MSSQSEILTRYGPDNGASFSPEQLIEISVASRNFLCLSESYLTATVTLSATAGTPVFEEAGVASIIDEQITRLGNKDIENLNGVTQWAAVTQRVSSTDDGINGYRMITQGIDNEGNVEQTWVLPIYYSGVWQKNACWPLEIIKQGMTLQIKLNSVARALRRSSDDATPLTDANFTVSNVFLTVSEKNLPSETREQYTSYVMDKYTKEGVMLNYLTYTQTPTNATTAETNPVLDLSSTAHHRDCVATFTMGFDSSLWNDVNSDDKYLPIKDSPGGASAYQYRINGTNTPNSRVSTSKPFNQIANQETINAFASIDVPVTNYETLNNSDTIIYARSFAGAKRSMDMLNKPFQLFVNLNSPAVNKLYFTYTFFIRTILIRPGSISVMD